LHGNCAPFNHVATGIFSTASSWKYAPSGTSSRQNVLVFNRDAFPAKSPISAARSARGRSGPTDAAIVAGDPGVRPPGVSLWLNRDPRLGCEKGILRRLSLRPAWSFSYFFGKTPMTAAILSKMDPAPPLAILGRHVRRRRPALGSSLRQSNGGISRRPWTSQ